MVPPFMQIRFHYVLYSRLESHEAGKVEKFPIHIYALSDISNATVYCHFCTRNLKRPCCPLFLKSEIGNVEFMGPGLTVHQTCLI